MRIKLTVLVTLTVGLLQVESPAIASTGSGSGYLLRQTITAWGPQVVTVTKTAMRIDDPVRSFSIVGVAPKWNITIASTTKHEVHRCALAEFNDIVNRRVGLMGGSDIERTHWRKEGTASICGTPTDRYRQFAEVGLGRKPSECYIASSAEIPKQISHILATYYDIPDFGGLPLRCLGGRKAQTKMDTLQFTRTKVPSSTFTLKTDGYKSASAEEVMLPEVPF